MAAKIDIISDSANKKAKFLLVFSKSTPFLTINQRKIVKTESLSKSFCTFAIKYRRYAVNGVS